MEVYFCLDTCTWIYLANGTEPVKFLEDIQELLNQNRLHIIMPEIVLDEWRRNKVQGTIHKSLQSTFGELKKQTKILSEILDKIGTYSPISFLIKDDEADLKPELKDIKDRIENTERSLCKKVDNNISIIENIFNHPFTINIPTLDSVILKAGELALNKKAPIHKKNGFADAVILLSFIDYIKSNSIENSYFISYNTADFCETENKKHSLHTDLRPLFDETGSKFFYILGKALKDIDNSLVDNDIIELIEKSRKDYIEYYCEECDGYHGFGNQIDFDEPQEIENKNIYRYTQNLPNLFSEEKLEIITMPTLVETIQTGCCSHCSVEYILCQGCGELIKIDEYDYVYEYANENIFICDCGIQYKRDREYDRNTQVYESWIIIDDRIEPCENCGEEFINEGITNICRSCAGECNEK